MSGRVRLVVTVELVCLPTAAKSSSLLLASIQSLPWLLHKLSHCLAILLTSLPDNKFFGEAEELGSCSFGLVI